MKIELAWFSFNGGVNTQKCHIWSTNNAHDLQDDLYNKKVTIWCGFTANCIIGPYYIEEIQIGEALSVTATNERYLQMLQDYASLRLQYSPAYLLTS